MKEIALTQDKVALVDDEDFERLIKFNWHYSDCGKLGYARRAEYINGKWKGIYMHREILKTPNGMDIDHINHNGIDNQKCNLRVVTRRQNMWNKINQAKTIGVQKRGNGTGTYVASIQVCGTILYIGCFKTEKEAGRAYMDTVEYFETNPCDLETDYEYVFEDE